MRAQTILLIAALLLALVPVPSNAQVTVATYSIPISYETNATYTLSATSPSANVSFTLPWPLTSEDKLLIHYTSNASTSVQLTVFNDTGAIVKTIQLSASPGDTIIIPLEGVLSTLTVNIANTTNLGTEVWSGTITVNVVSRVVFDVWGYPSTVNIRDTDGDGQFEPTSFRMYVKQKSGPSGSVTISASFTKNGKTSYDIRASFTPSFWSSSPGITKTVSVQLTATKLASDTYQGKIRVYFTSDARSPVSGQPIVDNEVVAELTFDPITIGSAAASGLLLGSIFGASAGMWAVGLAALFIIVVIAVVMSRR